MQPGAGATVRAVPQARGAGRRYDHGVNGHGVNKRRLLCSLLGGALVVGGAGADLATRVRGARAEGARDGAAAIATRDKMRAAVGKAAARARLGGLQRDERLERAALDLARRAAAGGGETGQDAVYDALWRAGVPEPGAQLLLTGFSTEQPEDMLAGLPQQLGTLLANGRWNRFGVGVVTVSAEQSHAAVLVLESAISIEPLPADGMLQTALGAAPLTLTAQPRAGYKKTQVMITEPSGRVAQLPVQESATGVRFALRCATVGAYKVEVLAQDARGPTVLANFPWYCGVKPPAVGAAAPGGTARGERPGAAEAPWSDARDAEAQVLALLNADRQAAGLRPLALDARLVEIARAHSADMRAHRFVAHVSPRTGSPADRLKRAGIKPRLMSENLAQASSPRAIEQSLMDSPGHRANILHPDVTHVGIGADILTGADGSRQLLVTQIFIQPF